LLLRRQIVPHVIALGLFGIALGFAIVTLKTALIGHRCCVLKSKPRSSRRCSRSKPAENEQMIPTLWGRLDLLSLDRVKTNKVHLGTVQKCKNLAPRGGVFYLAADVRRRDRPQSKFGINTNRARIAP